MTTPDEPVGASREASLPRTSSGLVGGMGPLSIAQPSEIISNYCRIRMLGAEQLFADRQGALVERPRPGKVALGLNLTQSHFPWGPEAPGGRR